MTRPVRVIVVAYGEPERLDRCLDSLGRGLELTVVDNSSSAAVRAVASRHGVTYLDPGSNLGFGTAANLVLKSVLENNAADVLLANPDTLIEPAVVERLSAYLGQAGNERLGAVSPHLVADDGFEQRVEWPFPTPWRAIAEAVGLGRLPARHRFVIGAVLMLRWEALREVGLFDERFFLYAEEVDWQRRAFASGWRSALVDGAVASHVGAATSADPRRREALFHAAHETYVRKWYGSLGWLVYRVAACAGAAIRVGLLRGDRRAEAVRRALLYAQGPRRAARLA